MKLRYNQKTESKLKVYPESMYIPQEASEITTPVTNKFSISFRCQIDVSSVLAVSIL